jgi:hypothetical protein
MISMEKYGKHNYHFKKKAIEESARDCIENIERCDELKKYKLKGFINGISKGKCPTILGDSLLFLLQDLEKQIYDYHLAIANNKPLEQDLANLINVAGCLFVKLNHIEKKAKMKRSSRNI